MTEANTHLGSVWSTLKVLGAIIGFALAIGSVTVAITRSIWATPSRQEIEAIKADVTSVKMEQVSISSLVRGVEAGLRRVEAGQERVEDKLDKVIESRRER